MAADPYSRLPHFSGLPTGAQTRLRQLGALLDAEATPSSIDGEPAIAERHIGDSLSGLELKELRSARSLADIGSGAGLPGLALAIALPGCRFDLVESVTRKAEFIGRSAEALGLENVRPIAERAESWAAVENRPSYDVVTARALAPLAVLLEYAAPLLDVDGVLVAWKGAIEQSEETQGDRAAEQLGMDRSQMLAVVPFEGSRDHRLYVFRKLTPTPDRYPRRPGMATKRPIGR